jgi:broad specificity phosphatase PhoE
MSKKKNGWTTIYVVRHGESESNIYAKENPNKPASHFGEYGSSLTQKGHDQVFKLAKRLHDLEIAAVFSSELNRARETAEIIASDHKVNVIANRVLRERYFGEPMSNIRKKEIEKAFEKLNEEEKFAFRYYPNGESAYDVVKRFKSFLISVIDEYKNRTIVVVSHGYLMRSFLIYEHFAKFDELLGGTIKNCGYFVIETDGSKFEVTDKFGIKRSGFDDEE